MRRGLRWVKRIVLGALALAGVLLVVALIVVHTDWGRERIRRSVEASLRDTFPGGVKIGKLEGSVLGELVVRDIEIAALDGTPAIVIGTARARIALGPLFGKTARIEGVIVEDVRIAVGGRPLTKPKDSSESAPAAWSVELPGFEVRRATFEFARPGAPSVALDDLALTGDLTLPAGGSLATTVRMRAIWRERKLPVELDASATLGDAMMIPRATVQVGDVHLVATDFVIDPVRPTGTVNLTATPAAVEAVMPGVVLPADVHLTITAAASVLPGTPLVLDGALGSTTVHGAFRADLEARTAAGFVGIGAIDVAKLLGGTIQGRGEVAMALQADRAGVRGVIGIRGSAADLPAGNATIFVDSTWSRATLTALVTGEGDVRAAGSAKASWSGKQVKLEQASLVAFARDLAAPTNDHIAVRSSDELRVEVSLKKPGRLSPVLELEVEGDAHGTRISYDDIRIARLDATFGKGSGRGVMIGAGSGRTTGVPIVGKAYADVRGVSRAGTPIGAATVVAELLADGRIWTQVNARPAAAEVQIVAGAYVTPNATIDIALAKHRVTPATGAPWVGNRGRISITDENITVSGLTTTNGSGKVAIAAVIAREGGSLDATVVATDVPASAIDATYRGTASGKLTIKRRNARWQATGTVSGHGMALEPDAPTLDGDATLVIAGRTVTLDARAQSSGIGGARLRLEVEGPRDITDVAAWRKLERSALRTATITVDKLDLATVVSTGGTVVGSLRLAGAETSGELEVRGVKTPLGTAEGKVTFSPLGSDLFASWNALLSDVGEANIGVLVTFPVHPFDPLAWKQLGRGVVQSLTASFDDIAIDPAKLAKLGVIAPYRGRADIKIAVGAAASAATMKVDVRGLQGGVLVRPLDVHVKATTDGNGTTGAACVERAVAKGAPGACTQEGLAVVAMAPKLLEVKDVKLPITFSTWIAAPRTALAAKLEATVVVPLQSAPAILALVGRSDFAANQGTIDGSITVAGTLGKPTGQGAITVRAMKLISNVAGRDIPELTELEVAAKWDGVSGAVDVTARESNGGTLVAGAVGRPDRLPGVVVNFRAAKLDLAPLTAFLPGDLASSSGTLAGTVLIDGLDPATSKLRGDLRIDNGQVPITPIIGTLHDTYASILMTDKGITAKARGLLGVCRDPNKPDCKHNVTLDASAPNDLSRLDGNLVVTKISPIGEIEPLIDGTARFELRRTGRQWTGDIYIRNGVVFVPPSAGDDLLEVEEPDDVYDIDHPPPEIGFGEAREPVRTWLHANVYLDSTRIEVEEYGVTASIRSRGLSVEVGDTIGLRGKIVVEYGDADDIFGRQYRIEPNELVSFDGTIDPIINLRLTHQFPDLLLIFKVDGRLSDDDFPTATFDSDPAGKYSQSELFGFFLGGSPSGASSVQTSEALYGAGASALSQLAAKRLKKFLPKRLKLDVIKCEPGTSTAGASCTVGFRLLDGKIFIAGKHRVTPGPNENAEELQLQYYLSREWLLEGAGGDANIIGTDLLWRRRW